MFFDDLPIQPKTKKVAITRDQLTIINYPPKPRTIVTDFWPLGDEVIFDIELYPNFFICCAKHLASQTYMILTEPKLMSYLLWGYKVIGFNSFNYDVPIMKAAIKGATQDELREISHDVIFRELRMGNHNDKFNHIDLIEVAPLQESLKTYAGRLHCERMQDLPFDPNLPLNDGQKEIVTDYCFNDLDNTELLYDELRPFIALRETLGLKYGMDLRSKSDAQIAEAVITHELEKLTGYPVKRPSYSEGYSFRYQIPDWISFVTAPLQIALGTVQNAKFTLDKNGSPILPDEIAKLNIAIGSSVYKMGIGGLHSTEKSIAHKATDEIHLSDFDVTSFYPAIILNCGLAPKHLGENFLTVFRTLVERRLEAKGKNKVEADALKILVNGTFGKLGSPYSRLYAPELLIQVTMTGQLALLMFIEALEDFDLSVVSANTDGVIVKYKKDNYWKVHNRAEYWQFLTNFVLEETRFSATYNRDVNNFLIIKTDGEIKAKGIYTELGSALNSRLSKNPETLIIADALKAFLSVGTPLRETIEACQDMRRFVAIRKATGGAHKDGVYLGRTVRWYYAKGVTGVIAKLSGDTVPKSEGAKPLMLLQGLEPDIDYDWYVNAAESALFDLGYYQRETERKLI